MGRSCRTLQSVGEIVTVSEIIITPQQILVHTTHVITSAPPTRVTFVQQGSPCTTRQQACCYIVHFHARMI